jgi:hypothetical protein
MTARRVWPAQWPDRKAMLDGVMTAHDYYLRIAQCLGLAQLKSIVLREVALSPGQLYAIDPQEDQHLSVIPLARWDGQHDKVRHLVALYNLRSDRQRTWTLAETVCVLKAVARVVIHEEHQRRKVAVVERGQEKGEGQTDG